MRGASWLSSQIPRIVAGRYALQELIQSGGMTPGPERCRRSSLLTGFEPGDAPQNGKVSKTDRCLDPACFDRKHAAFVERRETDLRAEHAGLRLIQVGFDGLGPALREKFGERVTRVYQPKIVKPRPTPARCGVSFPGASDAASPS